MLKITGRIRSILRMQSYLLHLLVTQPWFQYSVVRGNFGIFSIFVIFDSYAENSTTSVYGTMSVAAMFYQPILAKCREFGCQLYEDRYVVDDNLNVHRLEPDDAVDLTLGL